MDKILIADDNPTIVSIIKKYCEDAGFNVEVAYNGEEALDLFAKHSFCLVILDVMMPYIDGFEVCKNIRKTSNIPIIMVTARGEDYERIMGLDMGADDYIVKPFIPGELMARVRAILRRVGNDASIHQKTIENITVDLDKFEAMIDSKPVSLTKKEIEILWTMMQNPERVYTRDQLLDLVWGDDYLGDYRTVDTHIKRLRAKINHHNHPTWDISTVWGIGYKFEVYNHET